MNPKVKKKWLAALRSGQYKQCRGQLTDGKGFCCLGVLTNLYLLEKGETWKSRGSEIGVTDEEPFGFVSGPLPNVVMEWAGLDSDDPKMAGNYASTWNDDAGAKFQKIASLIEKHL